MDDLLFSVGWTWVKQRQGILFLLYSQNTQHSVLPGNETVSSSVRHKELCGTGHRALHYTRRLYRSPFYLLHISERVSTGTEENATKHKCINYSLPQEAEFLPLRFSMTKPLNPQG